MRVKNILRASVFAVVLGVPLASGCSTETPDPFILHATGGLDLAPFAGDPKVVRVELRVRDQTGAEQVITSVDPAIGGLDVPTTVNSSGVGALVLAGVAADSTTLAYGRTPQIDLSGIDNNPITILVQRPGVLTRAVTMTNASSSPRGAMLGARYLLVGDVASKTLERIDLLTMQPSEEFDALDIVPQSFAAAGASLLAIDASGSASLFVAGSSTVTHPGAPDGGAFADVNGGAVVFGEDEAAYLVGASRSSTPSDLVLRLATDGTLSFRKLLRARSGAQAAWVTGRGLVVLGGTSPGGADSPGVELLASGQTTAIALAFPGDATTHAVAASFASGVVRIDEAGVVQTFDLSCAAACAPVVSAAKADAVTARDDDAALALDRGGVLAVREGKLLRLDVATSTVTPLFDFGAQTVTLTPLPTGVAAVLVSGDAVVRTVE